MGIERRRAARFSSSIPAGFRFSSGPYAEGWGRILNISSSGLMLETKFPLKMGNVIYISFKMKGGGSFSNLRSRVVRLSYKEGYFDAGVAFDDVVDQETLRDVLSALAYEGGITLV